MRLLHKFFLAFFVTSMMLVGLILLMITVNLSSAFNDFVSDKEDSYVAESKRRLIALYQISNSWQAIVDDQQVWQSIVERQGPKPSKVDQTQPQPQDGQEKDSHKVAPISHSQKPASGEMPDFLKTGQRLSLYDQNKKVIVGKRNILDNPHTESISVNGKVVGWIGLDPSKMVQNSPANEFLAQQYQSYALIGLVVIVIAFTMAYILSRHLVYPVKQIISGTNKLTQGEFTTRIPKVTQDELGTLVDNFNDLAHTLDQSQNKRFQWMSDISHELRTPLTVLRSHLLAIQDGVFVADEKRIQLFIEQIDNLSFLVDDLYQLARSDIAGMTYKKVALDPLDILNNTLDNFKAKFEQLSLTVDCQSLSTCEDCELLGDKERLQQLFSNLLENTCRYTHKGGRLCVTACVDKQLLELEIQDSSPGVSLEEQAKLFERFYRVEKSRNRDLGGAGLGLALCKQIVEAHQGSIRASSSSLGGLTISIVLPLIRSTGSSHE